ncbi:MAG: isoprenylcysteine carboxylmethyltransferase family protein, partial [Dehalococcoidia bacterium]
MTEDHPGRAEWLLVAVQGVAVAVLTAEAASRRGHAMRRPGLLAGVLLIVAGLGLAASGSRRLGRLLRATPTPPAGAVLRTDGPYRLVRHPIYSGLLLFGLGEAVVAGTARGWVALGVLAGVLRTKATLEER